MCVCVCVCVCMPAHVWEEGVIYTVHLLNFRTGIIKTICVKEMTPLLFSFWRRSILTVHTDLHSLTASGCLCRSRPLQWCLNSYMWHLACCHLQNGQFVQESGLGNSWDLSLRKRTYGGRELNHSLLEIVQSEDYCMPCEIFRHIRWMHSFYTISKFV